MLFHIRKNESAASRTNSCCLIVKWKISKRFVCFKFWIFTGSPAHIKSANKKKGLHASCHLPWIVCFWFWNQIVFFPPQGLTSFLTVFCRKVPQCIWYGWISVEEKSILGPSCSYRGRCISTGPWGRCRGRGRRPAPRTCSRWRRSARRRSSRWSGWCRPPPPAEPASGGSCSGAARSCWYDPSTSGSPRRRSAGSPEGVLQEGSKLISNKKMPDRSWYVIMWDDWFSSDGFNQFKQGAGFS